MAEHQSDIWRQNPDSQLTEHVYQTGHALKFNEIKIIDSAAKESERLVKEAWFSTGGTIKHDMDLHFAYQALSRRSNYSSQAGKTSEHVQYRTVRSWQHRYQFHHADKHAYSCIKHIWAIRIDKM